MNKTLKVYTKVDALLPGFRAIGTQALHIMLNILRQKYLFVETAK